jgi:hypothetical protein
MKTTAKNSICILLFFLAVIHTASCRKENATKPNQPPVANAGADQTLILPNNSAALNGSGSTDPDNNITSYICTKISGPGTFYIAEPSAVISGIQQLEYGEYQFELKVTDAGGLYSKDTVTIGVNVDKEFIVGNLSWRDDSLNKQVHTQAIVLPNGYSIDSIKNVYLYYASFFTPSPYWDVIQKDGTAKGIIYYKIDNNNNGIIVYWYYETLPGYINLVFLPHRMKVEFL